MTDRKHTPGPWHYEDWTFGKATTEIVIGPEGMGRGVKPVAKLCGHGSKSRKGEAREPVSISDTEAANARLIAAAPDVYEALRAIVEKWNSGGYGPQASPCPFMGLARAALAKVEG